MNQRLVESVAQIVMAMSDDERRLLGRKLQHAGMPQLAAPTDTDKSLRVAEIAQDIQDFEEAYQAPLSALPADQWTMAGAEAYEKSHEKAHEAADEKPSMPTAEELTRA
mgnify:CR=1 FL=1